MSEADQEDGLPTEAEVDAVIVQDARSLTSKEIPIPVRFEFSKSRQTSAPRSSREAYREAIQHKPTALLQKTSHRFRLRPVLEIRMVDAKPRSCR